MDARFLSPSAIAMLVRLLFGYSVYPDDPTDGLRIAYHRDLQDFFSRADIELIPEGSMYSRADSTLQDLNKRPEGKQRIIRLIEEVCDHRNYSYDDARHSRTVSHINRALTPDGYCMVELKGKWKFSANSSFSPLSAQLNDTLDSHNFESVRVDFERALNQVESDAEDAITAACCILESICKCIMEEMDVPLPKNQDISHLVSTLAKHLKLDPSRQDIPPEIEGPVKQILGGLQTVSSGIGALRTHAGDAHGKGRRARRIDSRIARLAIHSASAIGLFFIETWQTREASAK